MKSLVFGLILLLATVSHAQTSTNSQDAQNLMVLKFSWNKERIGWEKDPFGGPLENFDEMRARARNERRILDAKRGGSSIEVDKLKREARADDAIMAKQHQNTRARYGFVYKVSLQNNGLKVIKSIDWDYVFFDANTQSELGRRRFSSVEKVSPGKTKELRFFIPTPPTKTVSVNSWNKDERTNLGERVVIVRVEYSDGSVWQQP